MRRHRSMFINFLALSMIICQLSSPVSSWVVRDSLFLTRQIRTKLSSFATQRSSSTTRNTSSPASSSLLLPLLSNSPHRDHNQRIQRQHPSLRRCNTRLFSVSDSSSSSTSESSSSNDTTTPTQSQRSQLLQVSLDDIGIDGSAVHQAAISSIQNPTDGYDSAFGRPAIRTYRAFVYPKKNDMNDDDTLRLKAASDRCARQVEFLIKRHASHETEWVRHHDTNEDGTTAIANKAQVFPLILILDNLRSAFNVGSIFRTADACGCQMVITTGITPHPNGSGSEKLAKSALGADRIVPNSHFMTTREAIDHVREQFPDFNIYALETTEKSRIYTQVTYPEKVALVLGNEVTGVDTQLMDDVDDILELPTFGAKNSLNVAACAPVVLYEILRQWKK